MGTSGLRRARAAVSWRRAAVAVVALATAVALVWLLGRTIDQSHTSASDSRLSADLQVAQGTLAGDVAAAARRATALARLTRMRAALMDGDPAALRALAREHPGSLLVAASGAQAGSLSRLGVQRVAKVVVAGKTIGRVVTEAPLDASYLDRVRAALPAGGHDLLVVTNGGRVAAGPLPLGAPLAAGPAADVRVAGHSYRALGRPLAADRPTVRIVALAARSGGLPSGWRLSLAVLATLVALFIAVAWLASPLRAGSPEAPTSRRAAFGSMALLGEMLSATDDEQALLEVIRTAAVEATGAASGRVVAGGDVESINHSATLVVSLETGEPGGAAIVLVPPPAGFAPEAAATADWLGIHGSTALKNAHRHRLAEQHALTDDLTGLANRRRFTAALQTECGRSKRFETPLAVLLADLDGFKAINDRFGHVAGDEVLKAFARTLERCAREIDLPARLGGDEFAVLLPQTDVDGARHVAERLRTELRSAAGLPVRVTASFGVSHHPPSEGADELLARADACLYRAKRAGRDMVVVDADAA